MAANILNELAKEHSFEWVEIDIVDDEALMQRYGIKIPVLQAENGAELFWPFSKADVIAFLAAQTV